MRAIDLFSGIGGFSTGATMAGAEVVFAANHWPLAVHWHQENHPNTQHECQDLSQCDWGILPDHDIGLASPCCQGFSRARGKHRPHHDKQRATMWAVVDCADYHRQSAWLIENVKEVLEWDLFPVWRQALEAIGYSLAPYVVDAADFGVPQHRERLFMVATLSKHPLVLKMPRMPHVSVNSVIDWDFPKWSRVHSPRRKEATLCRIASGRERFGERFVAPYYSSGSGKTGRSIHRPLGTLTTKDRWAIVNGDRMRMVQKHEALAIMGFPLTTKLPSTHKDSMHMLGNGVCPPVAEWFLRQIAQHA